MIRLGDKVLYKDRTDPRDTGIGYVQDVSSNRTMPYGVRMKTGEHLYCREDELELTSKLFAKCLIVGTGSGGYFKWAQEFACTVIENRPDAIERSVDIVVFTGGTDVNPHLYGEAPHPKTYFTPERDAKEAQIYRMAKARDIPCVGVCRGSQFLNVMNGGKLVQHVTNHTNDHVLKTSCGHSFEVTSTHHQMMDPGVGGELLAWAEGLSDTYEGLSNFQPCSEKGVVLEPEVVVYEDTKDLCIQFHPEYMQAGCKARLYVLDVLKDLSNI